MRFPKEKIDLFHKIIINKLNNEIANIHDIKMRIPTSKWDKITKAAKKRR